MALVTMEQARKKLIGRDPIWYVEMDLDQCTLENGIAPCTATDQCFFTRSTSKDPPNYTKGTRTFKFVTRGSSIPVGALPYLKKDFEKIPTKIDPARFNTERGEITLKFVDDDPARIANPSKTTSQVEDKTLPGRFWARLLARNPNTKGRIIRVFRGFAEVDPSNWELFFEGRIDDINWTQDGVAIRVKDLLWKLGENRVPNRISSTNVLQVIYNGGATMSVLDVTEFKDATANEPRTVKVENEFVTYTGKNVGLNQLTGCTPGQFGSSAVSHAIGVKVKQVEVYGTTDFVDGLPPDHIFLDLLVNYGEVPPASIDVIDVSATLTANITNVQTSIPITGIDSLPNVGIVRINNELIRYNGLSATDILNCLRGVYTTTAAAHTLGDNVDLTAFTRTNERWRAGSLYQAKIEKSTKVSELVQDLQQDTLCDVWQNEASKVTAKIQAPPLFEVTPPTITLTTIKDKSRKVDRNEEDRATRVFSFFDPLVADPSNQSADFEDLLVEVGVTEESSDFFDEIKEKILWSRFIYRILEADWTVAHTLAKYRDGVPRIEFEMEIRDDDKQTGDLIFLQIPEIVDEDGNFLTNRLYTLLRKEPVSTNKLKFQAEDAGFGTEKFKLIGPENGVLDLAMTAVQVTMDVDLSGTTLVFVDWRTGGTHAVMILSTATASELITYTGVTDLGGNKIRLTGLTRDADGALGAGVVHAAGDEAIMNFSAASDGLRNLYGWFGDTVNNELASSSFTPLDTQGYVFF